MYSPNKSDGSREDLGVEDAPMCSNCQIEVRVLGFDYCEKCTKMVLLLHQKSQEPKPQRKNRNNEKITDLGVAMTKALPNEEEQEKLLEFIPEEVREDGKEILEILRGYQMSRHQKNKSRKVEETLSKLIHLLYGYKTKAIVITENYVIAPQMLKKMMEHVADDMQAIHPNRINYLSNGTRMLQSVLSGVPDVKRTPKNVESVLCQKVEKEFLKIQRKKAQKKDSDIGSGDEYEMEDNRIEDDEEFEEEEEERQPTIIPLAHDARSVSGINCLPPSKKLRVHYPKQSKPSKEALFKQPDNSVWNTELNLFASTPKVSNSVGEGYDNVDTPDGFESGLRKMPMPYPGYQAAQNTGSVGFLSPTVGQQISSSVVSISPVINANIVTVESIPDSTKVPVDSQDNQHQGDGNGVLTPPIMSSEIIEEYHAVKPPRYSTASVVDSSIQNYNSAMRQVPSKNSYNSLQDSISSVTGFDFGGQSIRVGPVITTSDTKKTFGSSLMKVMPTASTVAAATAKMQPIDAVSEKLGVGSSKLKLQDKASFDKSGSCARDLSNPSLVLSRRSRQPPSDLLDVSGPGSHNSSADSNLAAKQAATAAKQLEIQKKVMEGNETVTVSLQEDMQIKGQFTKNLVLKTTSGEDSDEYIPKFRFKRQQDEIPNVVTPLDKEIDDNKMVDEEDSDEYVPKFRFKRQRDEIPDVVTPMDKEIDKMVGGESLSNKIEGGHQATPLHADPFCNIVKNDTRKLSVGLHDDRSRGRRRGGIRGGFSGGFRANEGFKQGNGESDRFLDCGEHPSPSAVEQVESKERRQWLNRFVGFMKTRNTPIKNPPSIAKKELDLYNLYQYTKDEGGYLECTKKKAWKKIADQLHIGPSTSGTTTLRRQYEKHILPYECHMDRGGVEPADIQAQADAITKTKKKGLKDAMFPVESQVAMKKDVIGETVEDSKNIQLNYVEDSLIDDTILNLSQVVETTPLE